MFKANKFGQGFATIEYAACVLVDIALHQLTDVKGECGLCIVVLADLMVLLSAMV
jgi:Zn-dependent oligopeptidase